MSVASWRLLGRAAKSASCEPGGEIEHPSTSLIKELRNQNPEPPGTVLFRECRRRIRGKDFKNWKRNVNWKGFSSKEWKYYLFSVGFYFGEFQTSVLVKKKYLTHIKRHFSNNINHPNFCKTFFVNNLYFIVDFHVKSLNVLKTVQTTVNKFAGYFQNKFMWTLYVVC